MRWMIAAVSAGLLAGCARQAPPPRTSVRHTPHPPHAQAATTRPQAPAPHSTPVKLEAPTPAPKGPGANIPLEGFRPMHGQSGSGA